MLADDAFTDDIAAGETERGETYVTFMLAGQVFAVAVAHVREILDRMAIRPLPNAPPRCLGVIDARGQTIAITDLAARLAMQAAEPGPDTRIVVFELDGERPVGVLADRVLNVTEIADEAVEPAPPVSGGGLPSMRGLTRNGEDLVILLDIEAVLDDADAPPLG